MKLMIKVEKIINIQTQTQNYLLKVSYIYADFPDQTRCRNHKTRAGENNLTVDNTDGH